MLYVIWKKRLRFTCTYLLIHFLPVVILVFQVVLLETQTWVSLPTSESVILWLLIGMFRQFPPCTPIILFLHLSCTLLFCFCSWLFSFLFILLVEYLLHYILLCISYFFWIFNVAFNFIISVLFITGYLRIVPYYLIKEIYN